MHAASNAKCVCLAYATATPKQLYLLMLARVQAWGRSAMIFTQLTHVIDRRVRQGSASEILVYAYEGMVRTQKLLLEQELIKVAK